jgi:hypothetical protein
VREALRHRGSDGDADNTDDAGARPDTGTGGVGSIDRTIAEGAVG